MSETRRIVAEQFGHEQTPPSWLEMVREQVGSLKFGTVLITVHDSRIVQVEKSEKLRLDTSRQ